MRLNFALVTSWITDPLKRSHGICKKKKKEEKKVFFRATVSEPIFFKGDLKHRYFVSGLLVAFE